MLNANGSEKDLSNIELYLANKTAQNGYDYGGKMTYTDGFKSTNATQKAFNDLKPAENSTYQISFTVYELRLRYKDAPDEDFVLQPGEQIEFCYSATIRENDLPMVYTASTYADDTAASTVDAADCTRHISPALVSIISSVLITIIPGIRHMANFIPR